MVLWDDSEVISLADNELKNIIIMASVVLMSNALESDMGTK